MNSAFLLMATESTARDDCATELESPQALHNLLHEQQRWLHELHRTLKRLQQQQAEWSATTPNAAAETLRETLQQLLDQTQQYLQKASKHQYSLEGQLLDDYKLAMTDSLTGLPNERAYQERLDQEYSRWRRYRQHLTLVMADIDQLRKINQRQGYAKGDEALKIVAELLKHGVRESDFVARCGGEQFAIIMPETRLRDALKAVQKLRQQTEKEAPVTLGFGVAHFHTDDTVADVVARAEQALQEAKRQGPNQISQA